MNPTKNLPLLLNAAYVGYNRALPTPFGGRGDFQPEFNNDGSVKVTFCNLFIQYVCNCFGYVGFRNDEGLPMVANEMHAFMEKPENGWIKVSDDVAQQHANNGVIVLASRANPNGHGHVCLILPGILENSGSFKRSVPKCANVGKDVFFGKSVSWAFSKDNQPDYFCIAGMV